MKAYVYEIKDIGKDMWIFTRSCGEESETLYTGQQSTVYAFAFGWCSGSLSRLEKEMCSLLQEKAA